MICIQEINLKANLNNGLYLSSGRSGHCVGTVSFPKEGVWNISMIILRKETESVMKNNGSNDANNTNSAIENKNNDNGTDSNIKNDIDISNNIPKNDNENEDEYLTVRLGTNTDDLKLIGKYYNIIDIHTQTVLYNVQYVLKGSSLTYRFDWVNDALCDCQLAVETGI